MRMRLPLTVLLTLAVLPLSAAGFTLTVLHTNDVHARYQQFNQYGSSCSDSEANQGKCFGGYARLKSAVRSAREKYPNSLFLDGGDQYQGTLWFYTYGHNVTSYFMNWVDYDVMSLGNHEFDRKIEGLLPFLEAVNFDVISANIDASQEPTIAHLFNKSVVRVVGNRTVGIVGYTTVDTPLISSSGKLVFNDVVTSVREEVTRLKAAGIDIIIALGHAGYDVDRMIGNIADVDIVVGGHTNTFLYTNTSDNPIPSNEQPAGKYPTVVERADGQKALVVQCFTWAKYFCVLHVTFDAEGKILNYSGNPQLQDNSVEQDDATLRKLEPWAEQLANFSSSTVGRTLVKLEGDTLVCRQKECNLGNLITDGMVFQNLRHPDELQWNDVSIALVNSGGIRATIDKGDITIADVLTVLPFGNTIDAVLIKGKHLRAALEHSISKLKPSDNTDLVGGFLQMSGLRVQYNLRKPAGQRVISVLAKCTSCEVPEFKPLQDEQEYKVILSSFIADGGDGYSVIKDNTIRRDLLGDLDSDVFIEYAKTVSPIYTGLEGRIEFSEDDTDNCQHVLSAAPQGCCWSSLLLLAAVTASGSLAQWFG